MVLQPFVKLVVIRQLETQERRIFLLHRFPTLCQARVPYRETKLTEPNRGNRRMLLEGKVPLHPPSSSFRTMQFLCWSDPL